MESKKPDFIIVGAGLTGSIIARELAEAGKAVLVVEKRSHIAGNLFDFNGENGVRIQLYGPHVFHTNDRDVYEYVCRFCEPIKYKTKCEVVINNVSTPSPFNFKTIDQFYSPSDAERLKRRLKDAFGDRKSATIVELLKSENKEIRGFAEFLFENDYRPYTAKQWGIPPDQIEASVLERVPINLSYTPFFFNDTFEFIPKKGFSEMIGRILDHPNIEIKLGCDALERITFSEHENLFYFDGAPLGIVFTGPIDRLFSYKFGRLPYRSLRFEKKELNIPSFQKVPIVAFPQEPFFTRITEYSKMPIQHKGKTTIVYEFPLAYDSRSTACEPYYPVLTCDSLEANRKYQRHAETFKNLYVCGRLADFKYYNMDQAVRRAISVSRLILNNG